MADRVEESGYWLPSEILDDFAMDSSNGSGKDGAESEFCFPTEFPYDLDIESEDLRLKKPWATATSTSPQSTLVDGSIWLAGSGGSSIGSPNGVASPPTTPLGDKNDAVGDLINRAAGQVAKLKLHGGVGPGPTNYNDLMGPPRTPGIHYPGPTVTDSNNEKKQVRQTSSKTAVGRAGQVAGPICPHPTQILGPGPMVVPVGVGGGGTTAKSGRAGTGVFLPRKYGRNNNNDDSLDSRKGTGYFAAFVPERCLYPQNKNNISGFAHQFQPMTNSNRGFGSDYDLLMVRRNAVMLQRGLVLPVSHGDGFLPPGWTN